MENLVNNMTSEDYKAALMNNWKQNEESLQEEIDLDIAPWVVHPLWRGDRS